MTTTTLKTIWIGVLAIIPAGIFYITDMEHTALFLFVCLYLLDIITGLLKAKKLGQYITSRKLANKTMFKFAKYSATIALAFFLSRLPIPFIDFSFLYMITWLALTEGYSNMENLICAGVPFPQKFIIKMKKVIQCDDCEIK